CDVTAYPRFGSKCTLSDVEALSAKQVHVPTDHVIQHATNRRNRAARLADWRHLWASDFEMNRLRHVDQVIDATEHKRCTSGRLRTGQDVLWTSLIETSLRRV